MMAVIWEHETLVEFEANIQTNNMNVGNELSLQLEDEKDIDATLVDYLATAVATFSNDGKGE